MRPEQVMSVAESYGVVQIPADGFIPAGKDVSALKGLGRAANEALAVAGTDDLAKDFVQAGDVDSQMCRFLLPLWRHW